MKAQTSIIMAVLFTVLAGAAPVFAQELDVKNSVVKVLVNSDAPSFYAPWKSFGTESSSGSGAIIAGNRILTNAHVVSNHTFIQVKKKADPNKYTAKVEAIANDCDLALLSVEDPAFFEGTEPIAFGGLPDLQDAVHAIGYPIGGEQISITEGVVSRVEMTQYSHSEGLIQLLAVQIDAAINPGNSGGPVLKGKLLVGVAFQGLDDADNVGYMVPVPVIEHFLTDLGDGHYDGFPDLGIVFNYTENKARRSFYGIEAMTGGVLVGGVLPKSPMAEYLQEGDVILEIDGVPVAVDGTVEFRKDERILFLHLIDMKQIGDTVALKLVRDGKVQELTVELAAHNPLLPMPHHFDEPPYYIYGGLLFSVLSEDLIRELVGSADEAGTTVIKKALANFYYYASLDGELSTHGREDIVVLLDVLPDEINVGYQNLNFEVITQVNGKPVTSFEQFVTMLHRNTEEYSLIDTEGGVMLILKRDEAEAATPGILEKYHVPAQFSSDVAHWLEV
ncbi:MAG: serine protease [Candidatus Omnitrophota bacterium]|nr:serine protease [Candidatus Omnitrophota bacterium]